MIRIANGQGFWGDSIDAPLQQIRGGQRFELPNPEALNSCCTKGLDGGGTVTPRSDPQGKTFSTALLRMDIEVDL